MKERWKTRKIRIVNARILAAGMAIAKNVRNIIIKAVRLQTAAKTKNTKNQSKQALMIFADNKVCL